MTVVRVLSIAGSDPSGGAGIQADLKSIAANGGYGMAAITALTAQNTTDVTNVFVPPASSVAAQLDALSSDIRIDAVKIGMLGNTSIIRVVKDWLRRTSIPYVVVDPVMVATSGDRLLQPDAEHALRGLLEAADLVTPNIAELAALNGVPAAISQQEVADQAHRLSRDCKTLVLAKGGHALAGADEVSAHTAIDVLATPQAAVIEFSAPRINTPHTHGTGCSLSSAIATRIAQSGNWEASIQIAKDWLTHSIASASQLDIGHGHGPIHHFAHLWGNH